MLTLTSAVTGATSAVIAVLVAFSIVSWSDAQIGTIQLAVLALGTLAHTWFNPVVTFFGKKA